MRRNSGRKARVLAVVSSVLVPFASLVGGATLSLLAPLPVRADTNLALNVPVTIDNGTLTNASDRPHLVDGNDSTAATFQAQVNYPDAFHVDLGTPMAVGSGRLLQVWKREKK